LFRHRHDRVGRGRRPLRNLNRYYQSVRLAREHIAKARALGWRGSPQKAVMEIYKRHNHVGT